MIKLEAHRGPVQDNYKYINYNQMMNTTKKILTAMEVGEKVNVCNLKTRELYFSIAKNDTDVS